MTLRAQWQDVVVSRLRVRGALDPLRGRQRIETTLADVRSSALGLPPHGVLVIRRIAPVEPLRIGSETSATRFRRSVRSDLERMAQRARRPWRDADAATADAVLFADEAELVACLVRDWLRGWVAERWWWRSVLGNESVPQWLRRHVLPRGELVAPALSLLATRSDAAGCVSRLDDADVGLAVTAVERAYAFAPLGRSGRHATPVARKRGRSAAGRVAERRPHSPVDVALERLVATVPEVESRLPPRQRRLLALALAVSRAPSWARSPEFVVASEALERSHLTPNAGQQPSQGPPHLHAAPRRERSPAVPLRAQAPQNSVPDASLGTDTGDDNRRPRSAPNPAQVEAGRQAPVARVDAPVTSRTPAIERAARSRSDAAAAVAPVGPHSETTQPAPEPVARAASIETFDIIPVPTVHTQFGGIFYLLNAAIALELYGDFTAPRAPGLALSPWDWLALTGQRWFGEPFEHDPVWKVLAALAGRDAHDAPGHEFAAPGQWAVAESWLAPWGRVAQVMYHATPRRLRLLHPAGYTLLDGPRDSRRTPAQQARAWCHARASLRGAALRRSSNVPRSSRARTPTARWMGWLLGYLQARLARSLGVAPDIDVPTLVCRHDADVVCSITSVDVSLSLAALPLPLRVAGLDRDPGWIPAAGRAIAFHFE